jgi:hypothetical protein
MRRLLRTIILSATIIAANTIPTYAEEGLMNSVSFHKIPANAQLQVQPLDNSDSNIALQRDFESALRAQGYKIAANAPLILTFETRDEIGAWSTTDRRHVFSFEAKGGREGGEDAKARFNVFDSQSGGLMNKGHGGTSIATPSSYRIDVTVEDRSTGKRLWQGWSIAKLGAGDGLSLTRKMVPPLVKGVGKTIRQKPFEVY